MSDFYKRGRAFIVQEVAGRNLQSVRDWGSEVIAVFPANRQIIFSPAPAVRKAYETLRDFNDADYLVAIGDPALIGIACAVAATRNEGRFNLLKWDRLEQRYYEVRIGIPTGR